jgi:uncharacterized protein HemX
MYLIAQAATSGSSGISWPSVILVLGVATLGICLVFGILAAVQEAKKTQLVARQEDALRQLIDRYEQLAEKTMDAQQRIATDVSELRSRTSSIEQILRTVE